MLEDLTTAVERLYHEMYAKVKATVTKSQRLPEAQVADATKRPLFRALLEFLAFLAQDRLCT